MATIGNAARSADLTIEAFRDEILRVGKRRMPDMTLTPGPGIDDILTGEHHLYVDNIYRLVQSRSVADREGLIVGWLKTYSPGATAKADAIAAATADWTKAKTLLRPKMMPQVLVRQAPHLIHQPFSPGIVVGYSIDLGDQDLYVSEARFAPWHVTVAELHDAAIGNLEALSTAVPVDVGTLRNGKDHFVLIETGDGYDASRILLPGFRSRLLAALGPTIAAGIPCRDRFVSWLPDTPSEFAFVRQVHDDAITMPHALGDEIFMIGKTGIEFACKEDPTLKPGTDAGSPVAPQSVAMRCDPMAAK